MGELLVSGRVYTSFVPYSHLSTCRKVIHPKKKLLKKSPKLNKNFQLQDPMSNKKADFNMLIIGSKICHENCGGNVTRPETLPQLNGGKKMHSAKSSLVVSTHLKNISQHGSFPQIGVKIKNI